MTEVIDSRRIAGVPSQYTSYSTILDRVLVKPNNADDFISDSGMQIPDKFRQQNTKGVVKKVGQFVVLGGVRVPLSEVVKEGDRVVFGEYNSEKITLDGEEFELVRVQDIRLVERTEVNNNA